MADMSQIANALGGFSAGLQGNLPQYQQVQNQTRQVNMQEQQQKQQAEEARQKTYFVDAAAMSQLLKQGNLDGVIQLGLQRVQTLGKMGVDPSDSQRLTQLAVAAKNGNKQAADLLKSELSATVQLGQAYGVVPMAEAPQTVAGSSVINGQVVQIGADGKPVAVPVQGFQAPAEKPEDRKTATDANGTLRYVDNGAEVFPGIQKQPESSKVFQEASEIRKEFSGIPVVKDFAQQATAMGRIEASASDPSPAGDLALIFNYMKVLDPGSTVREGEFANAQNAGNVEDKVYGLYNRVINGERLTENQRADFLNRGKRLYQNAEGGFQRTYDQYKKIAERRNLPVEDALIDYRYKFGQSQPSSAGLQPGQVVDGYVYNGGDPSQPASWVKQ